MENLVIPLVKNPKAGLAGGDISPLTPVTFIEKCVFASFYAFDIIRKNYRNGASRLTADGKILALKKDFADSVKLNTSPISNADTFIYFENFFQEREYVFYKKALIYYRLAQTISDFRNQESRTRKSYLSMSKYRGRAFNNEWNIPIFVYFPAVLKAFFKYPIHSICFKILVNFPFYFKRKSNFRKWNLALSTKQLTDIKI